MIINKLFSYKLLDINYSTPRKVVFYCTMPGCKAKYTYNAVRAQISSNGTTHYKEKHIQIAYYPKVEDKLIKSKLFIKYNYIN
jgi:hypothetical protein